MSNKTAVKWLEYQFLSPATLYSHSYIMDKLKQAKAMEKEQIMNAYMDAYGNKEEPEDYYNKTYGK